MGIKELCAIYGPRSKARSVLRRAVCAEIPGGKELCRLTDELYREKNKRPELTPYWEAANDALRKMTSAIAERYDLKTRGEFDDAKISTND